MTLLRARSRCTLSINIMRASFDRYYATAHRSPRRPKLDQDRIQVRESFSYLLEMRNVTRTLQHARVRHEQLQVAHVRAQRCNPQVVGDSAKPVSIWHPLDIRNLHTGAGSSLYSSCLFPCPLAMPFPYRVPDPCSFLCTAEVAARTHTHTIATSTAGYTYTDVHVFAHVVDRMYAAAATPRMNAAAAMSAERMYSATAEVSGSMRMILFAQSLLRFGMRMMFFTVSRGFYQHTCQECESFRNTENSNKCLSMFYVFHSGLRFSLFYVFPSSLCVFRGSQEPTCHEATNT